MKIESNGRGLKVEFTDLEIVQLQSLLQQPMETFGVILPKWVFKLDAALVAKINDNRGEAMG